MLATAYNESSYSILLETILYLETTARIIMMILPRSIFLGVFTTTLHMPPNLNWFFVVCGHQVVE